MPDGPTTGVVSIESQCLRTFETDILSPPPLLLCLAHLLQFEQVRLLSLHDLRKSERSVALHFRPGRDHWSSRKVGRSATSVARTAWEASAMKVGFNLVRVVQAANHLRPCPLQIARFIRLSNSCLSPAMPTTICFKSGR